MNGGDAGSGRPLGRELTIVRRPPFHVHGVVFPERVERDLLVTEAGTITYGRDPSAPTLFAGGYLIPGLVDSHAHLTVGVPGGPNASPEVRARVGARRNLEAGVLVVREMGAPDHASIGLGPAHGLPRVFSSGRWIGAPGRMNDGWALECDGEQLPDAAASEARLSGGWAKIIGDWRRPDEYRLRPSYEAAALARAVSRVHAEGGRIAIHAILNETIEMAISAGPDSIEHGLLINDDQAAAMAERGIALVPTIRTFVVEPPPSSDDARPHDVLAEWEAAKAEQPDRVRAAHEAGVTILAGTDDDVPYGAVHQEVYELVHAGVPVEAALGAASWTARRFLGLRGIEEGAPADIVAFVRDPLDDVTAITEPQLIVLDGIALRQADTSGADVLRQGGA